MKKTIGIIGGMGPMATADLFHKITAMTDAAADSDHLRVCIDSNTAIPDRTKAILHGGASPVPEMCLSARRLVSIGADILLIPCNTAHYFYDDVAACVEQPVLHMIRETAATLREQGVVRAGLLATDGTVQAGVYDDALAQYGIEALHPGPEGQQEIMNIIYQGVKAGVMLDPSGFHAVLQDLLGRGAQTLILGCTELPIAFEQYAIDLPSIDPTSVLAGRAILSAGGTLRRA